MINTYKTIEINSNHDTLIHLEITLNKDKVSFITEELASKKEKTKKYFTYNLSSTSLSYQNIDFREQYLSCDARKYEFAYLLPSKFLSINKINIDELTQLWDKINLSSKEEKVTKALQIIEPNIEIIGFTLSQHSPTIRVKIKGKDTPVPLTSMG